MRRLLLGIFLLAITAACTRDSDPEFITTSDIRLSIGGKTLFSYDEEHDQLGFNRQRCEFRVLTDNASDYFLLQLDKIPVNTGEIVRGNLRWTTPTEVSAKKNITFKTVKLEGDMLWLWSDNGRIAVCVRLI